jgi:aldose 1-epimerase
MRLKSTFSWMPALLSLAMVACGPGAKTTEVKTDTTVNEVNEPNKMKKEFFGMTPEGQEVSRFVMVNKNGLEVHVINYGAIITHLKTPDKNGKMEDIVLGYDKLEGYLNSSPYFGAIVGRYGNRIAAGKFQLDGRTYMLAQNNNVQHLHGGLKGFDKVFWNIEPVSEQALKLTYHSPDKEEGYPGNLDITVTYTLTDENALEIDYKATTDQKTIVNLTQHSYFNLTGGKEDILGHVLTLYADRYVPVNKVLIPEGELAPVKETPFDFTSPTAVGQRIKDNHAQLKIAGGYDHCWVINGKEEMKTAASLYEPKSGRYIEVLTTEPGIQFYSGNFLDGSITGKNGVKYKHRFGLCLETEHYPDSPNQDSFPPVTLSPGEVYSTKTIYRFGTR